MCGEGIRMHMCQCVRVCPKTVLITTEPYVNETMAQSSESP